MSTGDEKKTNNGTEFAAALLGHNKGLSHLKATRLLREVVQAVRLTGRKGSVTVKLEIAPLKNNKRATTSSIDVTHSIPEEKTTSVWFVDDEGGLHRNDPEQLRIEYGGQPTATNAATAEGNN